MMLARDLADRLRRGLAEAVQQAKGRLFRKYAVLLVSLVGSALVISSAIETYNSYIENREALIAVQREKAIGAATIIEQFVKEIEGQVGWTTHATFVAGPSGAEQRRFDFLRLLRQAPAITEVAYLDPQGKEQLRVSRLSMDVAGSGIDRSGERQFKEAKAKRRHVGEVYFRKDSEPYMALSIAGPSRSAGVTVAEVNLKFIWDVISRLRIGKAGAAYVVDERGLLIAHPDIGLVLRKTDLSALPQVAAARSTPKATGSGTAFPAIARDPSGREVLTASAAVATLGWHVFVDLPVSEAFEPLYASFWRSIAILLAALGLAGLAGLWLARRMVVPIHALADGAARIGRGDLDHRLSIRTGDEVETLAQGFNEMAGRLKDSYEGLERKVEERTRELQEALEHQTATAEVLSVISRSPSKVEPVMEAIVSTARRLCDAEQATIWRIENGEFRPISYSGLDNTRADQVSSFRLPLGTDTTLGRAALEGRAVQFVDPANDPSLSQQNIALARSGNIRAVLAIPLMRDSAPIGAISVARTVLSPFSQKQIELVETFADQAVIAIENARLFEEVQARTREVTEALEYQTATSEVLDVISRSPSHIQSVMDTIVDTARKLCGAERAMVWQIVGDNFQPIAFSGIDAARVEMIAECRLPLGSGSIVGRAAIDGRAVQIIDPSSDPTLSPVQVDLSRSGNLRTVMAVPLLRDGQAIGAISVSRTIVAPFSEKQVGLIETFADQAVIAIENVRLFEEVQQKNRELTEVNAQVTEALEQQTATAEILRVISSSPTDVQPVFEAIARSAKELCEATNGAVFRFDGDKIHFAAHNMFSAAALDAMRDVFPMPPCRGSVVARSILTKAVVHVEDIAEDPEYSMNAIVAAGFRSELAVPMLRENEPIGAIIVTRMERRPFSDQQIALLQTFAEQAVIAVNNVRLFDEVQARTRELTESLHQQTATADVLKVISRSTFDLQKVLDVLVETAAKLCEADGATLARQIGNEFVRAGMYGFSQEFADIAKRTKFAPGRGTVSERALLEARVIQVPDAQADPEYTWKEALEIGRVRTALGVPLMRETTPIGVLSLVRWTVRPFTEKQIELLQTFADQAVIAIENARLFEAEQTRTRELARSVGELEALGEVGRAVSSTLDLEKVLETVVSKAADLGAADGCSIFRYRESDRTLQLWRSSGLDPKLEAQVRGLRLKAAESMMGKAIASGEAMQLGDLSGGPDNPLRRLAISAGFKSVLFVPLIRAERAFGVLILQRKRPEPYDAATVSLLTTFASQSTLAIQNARLFREIEEKGEQLAIASRHKSQFLANMSHELRTPLNAVLGYTELIQDGVYGAMPEKVTAVLDRVQANGRHLLGLINDVLDLSKIEAGQLQLGIGEYSMRDVVHTVVAATEPLAASKKLPIRIDLAERLPSARGDERRISQVLLNLLGNAIKFTEEGEIRIAAAVKADHFVVSVSDTGPGIPVPEQEKIFEEFHQVDSSNTKVKGGTGLGLAISRRIIELHGGQITVDSDLGRGSTFTIKLPVEAVQQAGVS
jgi:GAF domain-containing protein/HAMP domain-containing protein